MGSLMTRILCAIAACALLIGCAQTPVEAPEEMIEAAKLDLATYLQIGVGDIALVESRPITWSSSAIGCAQSGVAYDDVEVPGYLILLTTGGAMASYHQGGDAPPFLCLLPSE
jgi:hypothetical protein